MSRPWKHPDSGFYWLRKGVPVDLRVLVGKREEKRSLFTRDPTEAKRLHAEALAELERRWANLRAGPKALTEREAHQMAVPVHDRWLAQHRDNPSSQTTWDTRLGSKLFLLPKSSPLLQSYDITDLLAIDNDALRLDEMEGYGGAWSRNSPYSETALPAARKSWCPARLTQSRSTSRVKSMSWSTGRATSIRLRAR